MEMEQQNLKRNETLSHDKGLLKYHQANYDAIVKEIEVISSAYSIYNDRIRWLIGMVFSFLSIGLALSVMHVITLGISSLFVVETSIRGYRMKRKIAQFKENYPSDVHLLEENKDYLQQRNSDLNQEKLFQQTEIAHLQNQIVELEREIQHESIDNCDIKGTDSNEANQNISYINVVNYEKPKRKAKQKKLKYHY